MLSDIIQIVRSWADDQNSDVPARHVLLIPNVLVYCDEDVKVLFSQGQQLPILLGAAIHSLPNLCFSGSIIISWYPLRTTLQGVAQFQLMAGNNRITPQGQLRSRLGGSLRSPSHTRVCVLSSSLAR